MNSTALAIIDGNELEVIQRTAKLLAASGYFGAESGIVGMAQVAAKIMAGRELGFGPFASVNGIHIIQGKPTVGANLMAAAVRAHPRYDYRVKELTDTACELEFLDNGKPAGTSRFTMQEAEKAELSTGRNAGTWKKYARNMLFARAMSNGVRWYAPDIFSGNAVYVPEELGAEVDGEGNVIEVEARRVDASTGEIVEASNDVPFDKQAQNESIDGLLKEFNRLGLELYADNWEQVCRRNVKRISGNTKLYADELTAEEMQTLIHGMQTLQTNRKAEAQQAEAVA